jgi:hypothetical protein
MSEIRPIFDAEAIKQLELVDAHLSAIDKSIDVLNKSKVSFDSFSKAKKDIDETAKVTDQLAKAQKA